jgi:hypothetical protein
MNLNDIMKQAASAYPCEHILCHWDAKRQCPVDDSSSGDSLAAFIVWEIYETYDENDDDSEQIASAIRVMRNAADELGAVVEALECLHNGRKAA